MAFLAGNVEGAPESFEQLAAQRLRLGVAALQRLQSPRDGNRQRIARVVAEPVVDRLEPASRSSR